MSTASSKVAQIPSGTTISILETLDGWYKVSYNGKTGYVVSSYVSVSDNTSTGNSGVWALYLNVGEKAKAEQVKDALKLIGIDVLVVENGGDA